MQPTKKKEKWGKPKLIMLVRSKPEECVLVGCKKGWGDPVTSGYILQQDCLYYGDCLLCSSLTGS